MVDLVHLEKASNSKDVWYSKGPKSVNRLTFVALPQQQYAQLPLQFRLYGFIVLLSVI